MKRFIILAVICIMLPFTSSGFNKLGHDITYYSSWMDYLGYIAKTGYSSEWFDRCVPINKDFEYHEGGFHGDTLMANEIAIKRLNENKYKALDDSTVLLLIKHLVHFLPDMHCPSHIIYNFRPSNYLVTLPTGEKKEANLIFLLNNFFNYESRIVIKNKKHTLANAFF